jgi:hypothetical protein
VDDPPAYSDPIIIPITMTIPWPHEAWRRSAGRFDIDGQANPPDFNTPERRAFERMLAAQNDVLAHQVGIETAMDAYLAELRARPERPPGSASENTVLAEYRARRAAALAAPPAPTPDRPDPNSQDAPADFTVAERTPMPPPPILIPGSPSPPATAAIADTAHKARQIVPDIGGEIKGGEISAAGAVSHNETPAPEKGTKPPVRSADMDKATDEVEKAHTYVGHAPLSHSDPSELVAARVKSAIYGAASSVYNNLLAQPIADIGELLSNPSDIPNAIAGVAPGIAPVVGELPQAASAAIGAIRALGAAPPQTGPGPAPDFVVSPDGTAYAVPTGAQGPVPVISPAGNQTGIAYTGGSSGANGQVSTIRLMNPTPPRGNSPGYPNGYIVYQNGSSPTPQAVDPYTGQTLSRNSSHFPIQ